MEGDAAGDPVTANEPNNDRLTYSLEEVANGQATDADVFQIDRMTGQVTVGLGQKVNPTSDDNSNVPSLGKADSFMVTIKATDPSGLTDTVVMTITVTAKDEDPVFTMGKLSHEYKENGMDAVYTFVAYDPEGETVAYSLSGDDAGKFTILDGALTFASAPNFEMPGDGDGDNTYEVMVKAASTDDVVVGATEKITTLAVMVEVTNVDDAGSVSLSATQPRIGVSITANDPVDEDGMVSDVTWQWSRADAATFDTNNDNVDNVTKIKGATMASYTPVTADKTKFLRATASYTDAQGDGKTAAAISGQAVQEARNLAPVFTDEDTDADGIQVDPREVAEDAGDGEEVGPVVVATDTVDADGTDDNAIVYRLSGGDTDSFTINSESGQIEVGANAMLDYETKKSYMVTVTASDLEGLNSSIDVAIEVTAVDEAPEIMRAPNANVAPEFASTTITRTVLEDTTAGENIGNPVEATDDNNDILTYVLAGTDAAFFDIDPATGQLMTKVALDFENKASYTVMVTATDPHNLSTSITVTIIVTNVGGSFEVSGVAAVNYTENGTGPVATYLATDPESATITWSVEGDDAADFEISADGVLTFGSSPDFEKPDDAGLDNVYEVTVKASDGTNEDTLDVTVTVTDVDGYDDPG